MRAKMRHTSIEIFRDIFRILYEQNRGEGSYSVEIEPFVRIQCSRVQNSSLDFVCGILDILRLGIICEDRSKRSWKFRLGAVVHV